MSTLKNHIACFDKNCGELTTAFQAADPENYEEALGAVLNRAAQSTGQPEQQKTKSFHV